MARNDFLSPRIRPHEGLGETALNAGYQVQVLGLRLGFRSRLTLTFIEFD